MAAFAVGGCGDVGAARRDGASSLLVEGRAASISELAALRQGAWAFAHSYTAALHRGGFPLRGATRQLERVLVAQRARVPASHRAAPVRVVAIVLAPPRGSRAKATMVLRTQGAPPFSIAFVLRRLGDRWLAAALVGG